MPNTLGAYNPIFYANETLIHLRKVLGMAARVHRGYELERNSFALGDTITIRKPSTFTAQNAPSSAQDIDSKSVNITLDQWKEVKFEATDKERAYTGERLIQEHIEPAAYALADVVDTALAVLAKDIPWYADYTTATDHTIITQARKVLFDNAVPMNDGRLHFMVDSTLEQGFLNSTVFHSAQVAGANAEAALMRGNLGTRFGVEVFSNQNVQTITPGTAVRAAGDGIGAVNGAHLKGATSLAVNGFTGSETLVRGDNFVIAGNTQRYAVTADATMSTGTATLTITPGLAAALAGSEVVTFYAAGDAPSDTVHSLNLMFHRNAFALALAPLPDQLPGIDAFTATDPVSGLSVRARRWADGSNSKLIMALDILYGVKTLDNNLACRAET
mgnify:CR=1 FL=1